MKFINERNNLKPVRNIIFVENFQFLANVLGKTKRNTETIFGTCFDCLPQRFTFLLNFNYFYNFKDAQR